MTRDDLKQLLIENGLERHAETLAADALQAIQLFPSEAVVKNAPIGASKFGGNPDLPRDFEWQSHNGKPLTFLAQFELKRLKRYDVDSLLPPDGRLYFFYDVAGFAQGNEDDAGTHFQILYVPADVPVLPKLHPKDVPMLPSRTIEFDNIWTLPDIDPNDLETYDDDELDAFDDVIDILWQEDSPHHQLLGHAESIQGTVEDEVAQIAGEGNWRLLLQLDSDMDYLNHTWGDLGSLYFCIREEDLQQANFNKGWMLMQGA